MDSPPHDIRSLLEDPEVLAVLEDRARNILGRRRHADSPATQSFVNRTVLRLLDGAHAGAPASAPKFENREQLIAYFVNALRWVLVDHARRRRSTRRGGDAVIEPLAADDSLVPATAQPDAGVRGFFDCLDVLRSRRTNAARVAELRYLFDFTWEETATEMGITVAQARSEWEFAKAWLTRELNDSRRSSPD